MLCDDLEGWNGKCGREVQEEADICIPIADSFVVQQKLTQLLKQLSAQPLQSYPTLYDRMDYSSPGSSIHEIL